MKINMSSLDYNLEVIKACTLLIDVIAKKRLVPSDKIYKLMYNPNIYESAYGVLGIYSTKLAAYKALQDYKKEDFEEWYSFGKKYRLRNKPIKPWEKYRITEDKIQH